MDYHAASAEGMDAMTDITATMEDRSKEYYGEQEGLPSYERLVQDVEALKKGLLALAMRQPVCLDSNGNLVPVSDK